MPPAKTAAASKRPLLDADYYRQLLRDGYVEEDKKIRFEGLLAELIKCEQLAKQLDGDLDKWFSKIDKKKTTESGLNICCMFKRTTGCEETLWNVHREVAHRYEFLKMAQSPLENRMLYTEGSDSKPFDKNLDRLMDFVKNVDQSSLRGFTATALAERCRKDKWESIFFDPDQILTYLSTHGGNNRRTRWDLTHNKGKTRDRPNTQPGKCGYSSNHICDEDKNTADFGRYDGKSGTFVEWGRVDEKAMTPYKQCIRTIVDREKVAYDSKCVRDRMKNMTKDKKKRDAVGDRFALSSQPKGKRCAGPAAAARLVLKIATDAEGGAKCNRYAAQNIQRFEDEWATLVRLAQSWRFHGCLNTVWTVVRMLSDSGCMVFSMPGSVYKPMASQHHRRLDDNVSYADPELTKLILECGLTDHDCIGSRTVNGAVCKVFKREEMEYILKPFAFIFDCETAMLRLTSATDFLNVDVKLFIRVRNILAQVTRGCGFEPPEEMGRRMNNPTDVFFGNHELHPLMKLEINFELLGSKRIHRRATLQELQDKNFPSLYKTILFASKQIEGGPFVIHNGTTFYAKYPDRDWALVERVGNEIVLDCVDEE